MTECGVVCAICRQAALYKAVVDTMVTFLTNGIGPRSFVSAERAPWEFSAVIAFEQPTWLELAHGARSPSPPADSDPSDWRSNTKLPVELKPTAEEVVIFPGGCQGKSVAQVTELDLRQECLCPRYQKLRPVWSRTCFRVMLFRRLRVFSVVRPNPMLHFHPFFVHPLFPVFEPHIQKWVIFVRRRPCVCDIFRFESPPPRGKKDRIWHRLPPPPSHGLRQLNFPNVKNDAGQKQHSPCFLGRRRPATPSQEHGLCPPWGFSRPFC